MMDDFQLRGSRNRNRTEYFGSVGGQSAGQNCGKPGFFAETTNRQRPGTGHVHAGAVG